MKGRSKWILWLVVTGMMSGCSKNKDNAGSNNAGSNNSNSTALSYRGRWLALPDI
ncbi:MAG: hypothetical protein JWR02_801 [Mucilaginibacter sp.]|nr:hypothetical protein [Mucilaginibacter sp.]